MPIDIDYEKLVTLTEAAKSKQFPKKPCVCTVARWCLDGVRGEILDSVVIGGRRYTSVEAIHRFVAATSRHPRLSRPTMGNDDSHRADEAAKRLTARGI